MPSVEQNLRVWDQDYVWEKGGDEWNDQAKFCNQPYDEWKQSLVETYIFPYIDGQTSSLEIGPGHGRWVEHYVDHVAKATLLDLSPTCIEICRKRFSGRNNIEYIVNDGRKLSGIANDSIDFVWSYDVFVHVEIPAIRSYFVEFARVVRPGGILVIHHADQNPLLLYLKFKLFNKLGRFGKWFNKILCHPKKGWRSFVSRRIIAECAQTAGLRVLSQTESWGPNDEYNCNLFHDKITVMQNPAPVKEQEELQSS